MIDSLIELRQKASQIDLGNIIKQQINNSTIPTLGRKNYCLMTMHRPKNVDIKEGLEKMLQILSETSTLLPLVYVYHPRTINSLKKFDLFDNLFAIKNLVLLPPQGYLEFLKLMDNAALMITDSGGIQEETTYLNVPCITFRGNTERPITVEMGTNILVENLDTTTVLKKVKEILQGQIKQRRIPPYWDGKAAIRITNILLNKFRKA